MKSPRFLVFLCPKRQQRPCFIQGVGNGFLDDNKNKKKNTTITNTNTNIIPGRVVVLILVFINFIEKPRLPCGSKLPSF